MFKRVLMPTIFSLVLSLIPAAIVFYLFNGFYTAFASGDGNATGIFGFGGYDWLIADVAANDDEATNVDDALEFISDYINPAIYTAYGICNLFLFFWLFLGRFLKVDKPGIAKRYFYYWLTIAIIESLAFAGSCYFWLYYYEGGWYLQENTIYIFCTYMFVFSFIFFLIKSWLFTSRVMLIAVPFVGLIKRISFRK
jgi:hypothetical protein|tara:strand:- start:102 stop:689 length:588 start_codon:yes stop_codon:yes gene_type:complete